ncbi:MAG: NADP-specific glutamate dehydrogenase, partial [Clostridia bacterium]|nr:NADP-specific glutamate dehydrogenase [Clostridia bacterium]
LYRHIGADTDVPAGDIGVGAREVGFMFGQYKKLRNEYTGVLTGKGLSYGGSLARKEATGYGLLYFTEEMLSCMKADSVAGKTIVISGSGNVAIYACEKAQELGGKVVALSDSNGYIYDAEGIKLDVVKQIKEVERARISVYADRVPGAVYTAGCKGIWTIPCDIALPCATQNEIDGESAAILVKNGTKVVAEGANMPSTPEAIATFQNAGLLFGPAKASNAGGVATSGLEMSQNSMRYSWTFEEVDAKLKQIMIGIFHNAYDASKKYGKDGDLVAGANIAGFDKIASAMIAQGVV